MAEDIQDSRITDKMELVDVTDVTLEEMVVTASREKEKKKRISQTIVTIDKIEIETSGSDNLGDLLAEKGIGHIHKYPAGNTSVGIRGFRTDPFSRDLNGHVLILLNGRRSGTGNFIKFLTKNIERIEIIRGPGSVQYGAAGMGGVINIITKQGREGFEGFIEAGAGSFSHNEQSVAFSGKEKEFDYSLSVTRIDKGEYKIEDGRNYANTNIDDQINASINIGYEFLPYNRLGLIYNFFDTENGLFGSFNANPSNDNYIERGNQSFDLVYDGKSDHRDYAWQFRYFSTEDVNNYIYPNKISQVSGNQTDQNGIQAQFSFNFGISRMTLGLDWVDYDINNKESTYNDLGFFLLNRTVLAQDRLTLSAGIRMDNYEIEGNSNEDFQEDVTFSLGAAYLIKNNWKLRLNYGQAFIMPTASQLFITDRNNIANSALEPERSETYELGIDYDSIYKNASLTAFYTECKNKIVSDKSNDQYTSRNVEHANISGIEGVFSFSIEQYLGCNLEVSPYISFVYMYDYEVQKTGDPLPFISDIILSGGLKIADPDKFNAKLAMLYTGEQFVDDGITGKQGNGDRFIKKAGFTVINLTANYKICRYANGNALWLHGEINNLFDRYYENVEDYPMAGRNFFVSLKYVL